MGLLSSILFAPLTAPAKGTIWVATKIAEAAEADYNDPRVLKDALRQAEADLLSGALSEEAYDEIETDILMRLRAAAG